MIYRAGTYKTSGICAFVVSILVIRDFNLEMSSDNGSNNPSSTDTISNTTAKFSTPSGASNKRILIVGLGWEVFSSGVIDGFEKAVDIGTPIIKNLTQEARGYVNDMEQSTS